MVPSYKTPGDYSEEISKLPASMSYKGDAVPAFIGYTQTSAEEDAAGILQKCKRIASLAEFERYFGLAQPEDAMRLSLVETVSAVDQVAYSELSAVLERKDRSPYILHYAMQLFFANGGGVCHIIPIGQYKSVAQRLALQDFKQGLEAVSQLGEVSLLVMPEAQSLPINEYRELTDMALAQCAALQNRMLILDVPVVDNSRLEVSVQSFRQQGVGDQHLQYGAAYMPNLITSIAYTINEAALQVSCLSNGQTSILTLLALSSKSPVQYQRMRQKIRELICELPPSAAIAAKYQVVERERGAWTAPVNVSLNLVSKPSMLIQNSQQEGLNIDVVAGKSINAIRQFLGKGILIWGSRTLAGNDNEFRYVPIMRLILGIQRSISDGIHSFLSQPNEQSTWLRIQAMVEAFLHRLWQSGAMKGSKPKQAYFVKIGVGSSMTEQDILEARLIIETGIAPIRPSEFIIIKHKARFLQR